MALSLVVEDGSALENSNSYVSLTEFFDYWELRNDSSVAALSDEAATAALVDSAQYMDFSYTWVGDRYSSVQAMSWPRIVFFDRDFRAMFANEVPQRIKDAQCILAREAALNGSLLASIDRGGRVQSEQLGPLAVSYFADAPSVKEFPLVDRILADLITGGGGSGGLTMQAVLS
jgi:hypothetical protein